MNLNPGQWTLCHVLKCESLKGMECSLDKCSYETESRKFKAINAQRRASFESVQEKQNTLRIVAEKAKAAELQAKGGR